MKIISCLALTCSLVAAANVPAAARHTSDDEVQLLAQCVAGTNLEVKLGAAFQDCEIDPPSTRRVNLFGDRDDACPTFQEIMDYLGQHYAEDMCVVGHLGWMDDSQNWDMDAIASDVAELPTEVHDELEGEAFDTCVSDMLSEMAEHECAGSYSDEEVSVLEDVFTKVAQYECFLDGLVAGCSMALN